MKPKHLFFLTVYIILFTVLSLGQESHQNGGEKDNEQYQISNMMGKAMFDETVEGLRMKVWIMTQQQHKKMLKVKNSQSTVSSENEESIEFVFVNDSDHKSKVEGDTYRNGINHEELEIEKMRKEGFFSGTHALLLEITDPLSGNEIIYANVNVLYVSPSHKSTSTELRLIKNYFINAFELLENGEYQLIISVDINSIIKSKQFKYTVR